MLTRLDHLVILVQDLNEATRDYEGLGFHVTPGGEHADGLTRNALVPFRDGAYLELVSFIHPEDGRDNVWGWREFLPHEGLMDYCAASDGMHEDVERLRGLGFDMDGPTEGGRKLPDGRGIRWRSASIGQEGRALPFLIEDLTPRDVRVPAGPSTSHPNGATGIASLGISVPNAQEAAKNLAALTGTASKPPKLGTCELVLAEQAGEQRTGPATVKLSTDADNARELDQRLAHGVRFALTPEAEI